LQKGPRATVPQRVFEETVTEPRKLGFHKSAKSIETLFTSGLLKIEQPKYADPTVSRVVDTVRKCIARRAGKPQHLLEKADLQIVALAVTHAVAGTQVELIFHDKALRICLIKELRVHRIRSVSTPDFDALIRRLKQCSLTAT
jgi:hypothetical protein